MKKLNKNFIAETDDLKAYISCSCPSIQCSCTDIYDPRSVQSASNRDYQSSVQEQSSYWNR